MPPTTVAVRPTWSVLCWNLTSINQSSVLHGANSWPGPPVPSRSNNVTDGSAGLDDRDRHALLYIVVVLLFYSTGIVIAIVMYLKREKAEIVEEKAYENYARFRSDPDQWTRYFRVQRMILQLDRVEREAAEKRRHETEIAEQHAAPPARRKSPRFLHRPTSASSALKIFVFGSESGLSGTEPTPLLSTGRGTEISLKPYGSAGGRLDVHCDAASTNRPENETRSPGEPSLSRTRSCDASTGRARLTGKQQLKRNPESMATLQVSNM